MSKTTAPTETYTLSLHDALPICRRPVRRATLIRPPSCAALRRRKRSEEHTSELQSREKLVCRLLLEKKTGTLRKRIMSKQLPAVLRRTTDAGITTRGLRVVSALR